MKYIQIIILIFSLQFPCNSQNLVINGNMEEDKCNISEDSWTGWKRYGSVDYIHDSCQVWNNKNYVTAFEGNGCFGLSNGGVGWNPSVDSFPYREHLIGTLTEELVEGESYKVSFQAKPSHPWDKPWYGMTTDQVSLAFIEDSRNLPIREDKYDYILNIESDINNENGILYDVENYVLIEGCYLASGKEKQFVIGNFLAWGEEELEILWKDRTNIPNNDDVQYNLSYVLIDNVIVEKLSFNFSDTIIPCGSSLKLYKSDFPFDEISIDDNLLVDSLDIYERGNHTLRGTYRDCFFQEDFFLEVEECMTESNCQFYVPNVISRSNQSPNNQVSISSNCNYEINSASIYDRWGNVVYQSSNLFNWDGRSENKSVVTGVYVYIIQVNFENNTDQESKIITGTITVVD